MCKICSDIEQYQKLADAGFDHSTSDMYWTRIDQTFVPEVRIMNAYSGADDDIPSWSLSKLLSFLPECIHIVGEYGTYTYYLDICQDQIGYGKIVTSPQGELVDAAVSILVWLHDNHERVGFMYPDEFDEWQKKKFDKAMDNDKVNVADRYLKMV